MIGIDRQAAKVVWTAALVLSIIALVYLVRRTLFVFTVAVLLAYLLAPLVNLLDRVLPASRTRTPALAVSYAIFVSLLILIGSQIGTQVVAQANALSKRAPEMLARWETPDSGTVPGSFRWQILSQVRSEITRRSGNIVSELPKAGLRVLSLAGNLLDIVIVPVLAFFFLKDGHRIRDHLLDSLSSGPRRVLLDDVMNDVHILLAQYMRALVLLSIIAFAAYWLALSVIGVPYSLLLACTGCLLEFIPMLGPITAGVIITVVAAVAGAPVGVVIAVLIGFRMLQDYGISPQLMGNGVELPPLLILFGVFAGAELAGIPGTFLSVPAMAAARIVVANIRRAQSLAPGLPVST